MVFTETIQSGPFRIITEFAQPLVCGENGNFTVWLENITDKPTQNLVLREKTFKLTTTPFDLFPHEKCKIIFNVAISSEFEYSPPLQFQFLRVLPPFPCEFYKNAATPEFPNRQYEFAEARISSLFKVYERAETIIPAKIKLGKKSLQQETMKTLRNFSFPEPQKTNETGGALIFNLEGKDYAVVQAYVMPSENDDSREILFWLIPCTVELVTRNKRVARLKFAENEAAEGPWSWRFIRDKASDFQILMDFLTKKYNENWLLHVIFDGEGSYQFENLLVIP